jgi:hypothetical protein
VSDTDPPTRAELLRAFAAVVAARGDQVRSLLPDGQAEALLEAVARFVPPATAQPAESAPEAGNDPEEET